MSNYTKSTNFATKDNLTPGDPLKVVRGTEIDTEFNNISTAIATKTDNSAAAITGGAIDGATVGATTPATGAFTTLAASGTTTLAGALVGAATQSAFNTVSTTLNLGGAATALNLGAATGTATVNNTTLAAKAITASTTLAVTGTSTLTGAVTATAGVSGPITSSSVSITGGSITGITDLAVADGGTGASTAAGGLNNLLPSQTGNASKYLQTDGTNASWDAVSLSTADITGTLGAANGGTGVSNNAAMTVTGSGNFAYTRTLTGTTNVTFPTTGTLATLAGTETLTNKTLTSPILTTPTLGVATGTSFQGIIGNVTPAAGAFTTVTASTAIGTASGGTGLGGATPFTSGGVVYASSSSALATGSTLYFDGTNLGVGNASPQALLHVGSVVEAPGFGTTSQMTYVNGTSQPEVLVRQTTNDVVVSMFADSTSGSIRTATNHPLIFSTNNSEGLRLTPTSLYTASGINVGIGNSNPLTKLHVSGGNIRLDNNQGLEFGGANNYIYGNETTDFIALTTNGTEAARINSAGGLKTLNTISVGNATPSTSGAGITFPATQSASSDAKTLDDYEEGTWTGTMTGVTTAPTTPVTATGTYTKIGNVVNFNIRFSNVNTTGASGQLIVTGLPFTSINATQIGSVASYGLSIPNKTLNSWISGLSTNIEFVSLVDNGNWGFPDITAGASKYLAVTATYFV